jgi:hypothetical protein
MFPLMLVTAAIVATGVAWSLPRERRLHLAREVLLLTSLFFLYFWLRGVTEGGLAESLTHAEQIEDLERSLGIFREGDLQQFILDTDWIVELSNLVYIWAHWPVLGAVAIWLYRQHPTRYPAYRNAVIISGALGVLFFEFYPTAPPRIASPDIVGTVGDRAGYYENFQPSFLSNEFAAVPSLHVGWSVLMGIALVRESRPLRGPRSRVDWTIATVGVLMPLVMTWAVIVTGNHYFIDGVVGTALSVGGLLIALRLLDRHRGHATLAERAPP